MDEYNWINQSQNCTRPSIGMKDKEIEPSNSGDHDGSGSSTSGFVDPLNVWLDKGVKVNKERFNNCRWGIMQLSGGRLIFCSYGRVVAQLFHNRLSQSPNCIQVVTKDLIVLDSLENPTLGFVDAHNISRGEANRPFAMRVCEDGVKISPTMKERMNKSRWTVVRAPDGKLFLFCYGHIVGQLFHRGGCAYKTNAHSGMGMCFLVHLAPNRVQRSFHVNEVVSRTSVVGSSSSGTSKSASNDPQNMTLDETSGHVDLLSSANSEVNEKRAGFSINSEEPPKKKTKVSAIVQKNPAIPLAMALALFPVKSILNYVRCYEPEFCGVKDEDVLEVLAKRAEACKAPLSDESITKQLEIKDYASVTITEQDCSICMAEYQNQDKIGMLYYCSHVFHADCLRMWILKQNSCPVCRALALIPASAPEWNGGVESHREYFIRQWESANETSLLAPWSND